jgi:hypothetical protein
MKDRTFVLILILYTAVLVIAGSCGTMRKAYVAQEDEAFYGTWVNPDYGGLAKVEKVVHDPDGVLRFYSTATSTKESWRAKFIITGKWTDAQGNIWYQWLETEGEGGAIVDTGDYYFLGKISDAGRVIEMSFSSYDYPTEVNPDSLKYDYRIYYRQ